MWFRWPYTVLGPILLNLSIPVQTWDLGLDFLTEPTSVFANPGQRKVAFRCAATPTTATIEWLQNGEKLMEDAIGGVHIMDNKLVVKLPKEEQESGPGRPNNPHGPRHHLVHPGGLYLQCLARYKGRALISQPARLIAAELAPFQSQQDEHVSVIAGNSAVIPCTPPYSVPNAVTEFQFRGVIITKTKDRHILLPSGNLQIANVSHHDEGAYRCRAYNPYLNESTIAHHVVHLRVIDATHFVDVNMTRFPPSETIVVTGSNVTLECSASGFPTPNITWIKKDGHLPHWRHVLQSGNLRLFGVCRDDEGTYVCQADNNQRNPVLASTVLEVQETPHIVKPPHDKRVHEGETVTFECIARGQPKPVLTWYHNGMRVVETGHITLRDTKLIMHRVTLRHAGIYQCFASSELGAIYAACLLNVVSESSSTWNGHHNSARNSSISLLAENSPTHHHSTHKTASGFGLDYEGKKKRKKKKHKGVKLILPTRPEVSRLTENSVMVRWDVPQNDGLPILFFKVQYREASRRGGIWMTIDDDIAAHIHSYAVNGLKSGAAYRFRIAAVYSNYDNQRSPNSAKFMLYKDPPMKKPSFGPTIMHAEAASPSAITLRWESVDGESVPIEGFFIYYRATHSAGDYLKVTSLGANTRSHIISHLLPETSYDIKMQCFNIAGTSDFSNIYTCKTLPSEELDHRGRGAKSRQEIDLDEAIPVLDTSKASDNSKLLYIVLGIVLGVLVLVLTISVVLCFLRHKQQRSEAAVPVESLPKPGNGHLPESNGFIPRAKINISVNPLSEADVDKSPEGTYPLVLHYEVPSNNNEVILLGTLERTRNDGGSAAIDSPGEQIIDSGGSREEEV